MLAGKNRTFQSRIFPQSALAHQLSSPKGFVKVSPGPCRYCPMKSKLPFILVAVVTASLAYVTVTYSANSKASAGQTSAECCDPEAGPTGK